MLICIPTANLTRPMAWSLAGLISFRTSRHRTHSGCTPLCTESNHRRSCICGRTLYTWKRNTRCYAIEDLPDCTSRLAQVALLAPPLPALGAELAECAAFGGLGQLLCSRSSINEVLLWFHWLEQLASDVQWNEWHVIWDRLHGGN